MRIEWSKDSGADLREIHSVIAQDDPIAAARVIREIRTVTSGLSGNPLLGRVGGVEGTRELVLPRYPYLIIYRLLRNRIRILSVVHTARHWQPDFDRT